MSAEARIDSAPGADASDDELLSPRIEQLRSLRSAWGVLAPVGLVEDADEIGATGRALTEHLSAIVESHSDVSATALAGIDTLLSEFETSIRHVATSIAVGQLRSALPSFRDEDRRGLLDLLDLLVARTSSGDVAIADRIGAIDYLITLLCAHGAEPGAVRFDPVTLTDRLAALCADHDDPDDARLAEVEAEFFAAATLDATELREELQQRTLRQRKIEIGVLYFAPRVLRAIVTYNAALYARVEEELLDSADWGEVGQSTPEPVDDHGTSVFDSEPFRALASAIGRRLAGETPEPRPVDRIAWALDLDYLADNERKALQSEGLATADDPLGTAVLIGLVSRSVAVLGVDLQDAGLPPDRVTGAWVDELSEIFQNEINQNISNDAYKVACALSELKNKFLLEPLADHLREERAAQRQQRLPPARTASPKPEDEEEAPRENARTLVRDALSHDDDAKPARVRMVEVPWAKVGRGLALAAIVLVGVGLFLQRSDDLGGLSSAELQTYSAYLASGERDAGGTGQAFVGEVDDAWLSLPISEREALAEDLVDRLRAAGMQQVMIYDGDRRVRIQALGSQPVRVL